MHKSKSEIVQSYLEQVKKLNTEASRSQRFTTLLSELIGSDSEFYQEYVQGLEYSLSTGVKSDKIDSIVRGRADSLIGNLIVEFEPSLPRKLDEACEQLKKYAAIQWANEGAAGRRPYICIATDGERFYSYSPRAAGDFAQSPRPNRVDLVQIEYLDWTKTESEQALYWIDRHFLRRERLVPASERIEQDFGPLSHAFLTSFNDLNSIWDRLRDKSEFAVLYENWDKYLRIVYGEKVAGAELFIKHTYLATLAKLMVWIRIEKAPPSALEGIVGDLLGGSYFQNRGLVNFLEEDFFSWLSREEALKVATIVSKRLLSLLDKYDFAQLSEDVVKSLYQALVDPETRHDLGEFYTPDGRTHS